MANNLPIARVRFYCDQISYRLSRGIPVNGRYDVQATNSGNNLVGIQSGGGSEDDLFDMRPSNLVTFDTAASATTKADHVVVSLDTMGESSSKHSFIAILNHNLATATGKIRIAGSDTESHVTNDDLTGATSLNCTEIVNAGGADEEDIITPASDGSTIVTMAENDLRYIGIQFEGSNSGNFSSTNLTVGSIMIGEYFDAAPVDVNLTRTIDFDGVNVQESIGGQRFSTMLNHGRQASSTSKSPFVTTTSQQQVFGGRMIYELTMSHVAHDELMPAQYNTFNPAGDSFVNDVWNMTNGNHLPFIFSIDNTHVGSNAESSHIFARFGQSALKMQQVASNRFNFRLRIEEEF
jgi:hypothetical protein|tara:strand:- start:4503 stop:5552 length:1050 start_codon:yes stop_codon:yes gene_type:complete